MINILLVEDSEEDVFFFKRALSKTGLHASVRVASNGRVAVEMISNPTESVRIDFIFLDLKMPVFSGFDFLRWIRQENIDSPPIIVLTGSFAESDRNASRELGACDFVVKPITTDYLCSRLLESIRCPAGETSK